MAINAGAGDPFNHAVSFHVVCETQAEIDRYRSILFDGSTAESCGWLKDRCGLSWQITSAGLGQCAGTCNAVRKNRNASALICAYALARFTPGGGLQIAGASLARRAEHGPRNT